MPDWEALRDAAAAIKAHTLSRLADYLEQFERNATRAARRCTGPATPPSTTRSSTGILAERGVTRLVKSKSMLTEECHLNPYLEARGIEVVDTDLGERIVQLAHEPPSHIVLPAIHLKKEEIGELFHAKLGTAEGRSPTRSTSPRRRAQHLREQFLAARGRAHRRELRRSPRPAGSSSARTRATPTWARRCRRSTSPAWASRRSSRGSSDLAVFLRLLARSATGQPITTYTIALPRADGRAASCTS